MQFNPEKHTKEYLLNNPAETNELAWGSEAFAVSELANDYDVLALKTKESTFAVAHTLAMNQPLWALQPAANNYDVLAIASTTTGGTVAARLAKCQKEWVATRTLEHMEIFKLAVDTAMHKGEIVPSQRVAREMIVFHKDAINKELLSSLEFLSLPANQLQLIGHYLAETKKDWLHLDIAKSFEVLSLRDYHGNTVAHSLAKHQPDWIHSKEVQSDEILNLENNYGARVAHALARYQRYWDYSRFTAAMDNLKLQHRGSFGEKSATTLLSLAHELADNPLWAHEAEAAFKKEILTMTSTQWNGDELSVAEVLNIPVDERISRVIKTGAAFMPAILGVGNNSTPNHRGIENGKITKALLVKVVKTINEFIEGVQGAFAEVKLRLALYQTLQNLQLRLDASEKDKAVLDEMAAKEEKKINKLVLNNPEFAKEMTMLCDSEPGLAGGLIRRVVSQHHFSSVTIEPEADEQRQEAPGLY